MKPGTPGLKMMRHPDAATLENRHLIWAAIKEEVEAWRRRHRRPDHWPVAQLHGRPDWALDPVGAQPQVRSKPWSQEDEERIRLKRRNAHRYREQRALHAAAEKEALRAGREVWRGGIDRNGNVWCHQVHDWEAERLQWERQSAHEERYWDNFWRKEREKREAEEAAHKQALEAQRELNRQAILATYTPEDRVADAAIRARVRKK